jgi:hypothetical protein
MVLTGRVRNTKDDWGAGVARASRRSVLRAALTAAAVAIPVTGCDLLDRRPEPTPSEDPLTPLINGALDLANRYDAAIAARPDLAERLAPVAQAHRAHAAELAKVTGTPVPSPTGSPSTADLAGADANTTLTALRAAEQSGWEAAVNACLAAPDDRAALLGSIAAARATHLEVLG